MKAKFLTSLLIITPVFFISCKKELEPQVSFVKPASQENTATTSPTISNQTGQNQTTSIVPSNASAASGMNPAHGQPGHVCGIAVGAPLNSATPQQKAAPVNQVGTAAITAAPTTKTAPGMNPPHGQPGHVCGTAVGQPLNSSPGKAAAPTTTQTIQSGKPAVSVTPLTTNPDGSPSLNPNATPAILNAPTTTAPGMNPPHGQPGHVCGTAVGSPLPK